MAQQSQVRNPFMLMIAPEVVLAAIENSEHLRQLNRHLCRPLDRLSVVSASSAADISDDVEDLSGDQPDADD